MSDLALPEHVQTILITGAGGFVGRELTKALLSRFPHVSLVTTDVVEPPTFGISDSKRLTAVAADLGDPEQVNALFSDRTVQGVFALHGIMSGESELDFEKGYRVNVDAHLALLRATHAHAKQTGQTGSPDGQPLPVYVTFSSHAVYGGPKCRPQDHVKPDETPLVPESSYGVAKAITELYTYDYARRGYLDARNIRLPTVAVRTGAPSSAASSFISGTIREPLQGLPSELPIAKSFDDPILDELPVYLASTKCVVRNVIYSMCMPADKFPGPWSRTVNLPGITITPRQILAALEKHGGKKALDLITCKPNDVVIRICKSWAGSFDNTEALRMGFTRDDEANGFDQAVQDFKAELAAA